MRLTEGQMSDHKGAALMLPKLPPARELIGAPGLRQRLVPHRTRRARRRRMHPIHPKPQSRAALRQNALPPASPHRERLRPHQGLAADRVAIRPMRAHLLLGHLHRSYRHLLIAIGSPDPRRASCVVLAWMW
jgi:hypothetical protein